ncbi:hypothetical protein, partial [Streptomyces violascens]|uniref:hypothetical protein n=1 Tax=Streptomyces violascens TaxID=67381 RepID=UPI0036945F56
MRELRMRPGGVRGLRESPPAVGESREGVAPDDEAPSVRLDGRAAPMERPITVAAAPHRVVGPEQRTA